MDPPLSAAYTPTFLQVSSPEWTLLCAVPHPHEDSESRASLLRHVGKNKGRKTAGSSHAAHPDRAAFKNPSLATHPPLTLFSPLLTVSAHPSTHARSKMGPVLTPTVPQASSPLDLELGTQFVARSLLSFPRSTLPRPAYKMKPQSRFWPPGSEIPLLFTLPSISSRQSPVVSSRCLSVVFTGSLLVELWAGSQRLQPSGQQTALPP